jgi:catechol 2,3-dioxygenase-like lactoylglutathione lyase family enzyme
MSDWSLLSLFHFTVNATSFEASVDFYKTLGFRVLRDNRDVVWPDYVATQFGMERAQGRGCLLAIDDGEFHTRLDLIEWLEPCWQGYDGPIPRIMALRTANVRAAYDDLSAKGIEFITPVRGPDAQTGIEGVVCCRDPDGLIVEFIEYSPGLLGSRVEALETRDQQDGPSS